MLKLSTDRVHPDDLERAEALVTTLPSETQDRYHGATAWAQGQSARASGFYAEDQAATDQLIALESEENSRRTILRMQNSALSSEEEAQFASKKDRLQRKLETLRRASAEARPLAEGARDTANRTTLYLADCAVDGAVLKLKNVKLGRTPWGEQLVACQEEQRTLRRGVEGIRKAGTPVATLKKQLLAAFDALQGSDPLGPFALTYYDGTATMKEPVRALLEATPASPGHIVKVPDFWPILLALLGDEIRERYLARIDRDHEGDTSLRLDAEEKQAKLADLRARNLELQYLEGALTTAIAGPGALEIPFRAGLDPRAVLGVIGPPPRAR